ncbi:MAG TPA: DUF1972 domain-containing protein [Saprospiraceae bacterium]|nr:DUF1972 domain-containing protein [Saprospiraceae bacterium]
MRDLHRLNLGKLFGKKVAIIGTRGIPNRYGGFEQFTEFLAPALVKEGLELSVYCSHDHPLAGSTYEGVHLIRCKNHERSLGSLGHLLYDLFCILDARKRGFDIILQMGYTTNGIWQFFLPTTPVIVSNMDGLEWKRSKYKGILKTFLRYSEKKVANRSDHLIGDALPICAYLESEYNTPVSFITYCANEFIHPDPEVLKEFDLVEKSYYLIIARMQPDNHIEMIIEGFIQSHSEKLLLIVGNTQNSYGKYLRKKFRFINSIRFAGSIFDQKILNQLRFYSDLYFHGHSAGGTNPSLLEAMACRCRILAHDNIFNRSVAQEGVLYFSTSQDLGSLIRGKSGSSVWKDRVEMNVNRIKEQYNQQVILEKYMYLFAQLCNKK